MSDPQYFIIPGAQKAGSTYLHQALKNDPKIWIHDQEFPLFETGRYKPNRIKQRMQKIPGHFSVRGFKRPNIMYDANAVQRVKHHLPDVKFIILLRNPVSRFVSAYFHRLNNSKWPMQNPNEYVKQMNIEQCELIRFSFYSCCVKNILNTVGNDNTLITWQEELKNHTYETLKKVYDFLDVPFHGKVWYGMAKQKTDDYVNIIINRHIHRMQQKDDKPKLYYGVSTGHKWYFNQLKRAGYHLNKAGLSPKLKFTEQSIQKLKDIFEPDVQKLYSMLDIKRDPLKFYD